MSASTPKITTRRDLIVARADSLADLVARAEVLDPALAVKLKGRATIASATPVGALIGGAVGLIAARYGLGLNAETVNLISGVLVLAGGYVAHWVQARLTRIVAAG